MNQNSYSNSNSNQNVQYNNNNHNNNNNYHDNKNNNYQHQANKHQQQPVGSSYQQNVNNCHDANNCNRAYREPAKLNNYGSHKVLPAVYGGRGMFQYHGYARVPRNQGYRHQYPNHLSVRPVKALVVSHPPRSYGPAPVAPQYGRPIAHRPRHAHARPHSNRRPRRAHRPRSPRPYRGQKGAYRHPRPRHNTAYKNGGARQQYKKPQSKGQNNKLGGGY